MIGNNNRARSPGKQKAEEATIERRGLPAVLAAVLTMACLMPGCGRTNSFSLTSPAFENGASIPQKYGCDGQNISPPLAWAVAPAGTQAFALIMHDPDAKMSGGFTHWIVYDIPAGVNVLEENLPKTVQLPNTAAQGNNSSNAIGYTGPCPPPGPAHHYFFTLYALDKKLSLRQGGVTKNELEGAMKGHIMAEARLTGLYQRSQ